MVTIASRTPEGSSEECPLCGTRVVIEPSFPANDAPCPSCGYLVFFSERPAGFAPDLLTKPALCDAAFEELASEPIPSLTDHLLTDVYLLSKLAGLGIDSIDLVEIVLELEMQARGELVEVLGDNAVSKESDDQTGPASTPPSLRDVLRWIRRRRPEWVTFQKLLKAPTGTLPA